MYVNFLSTYSDKKSYHTSTTLQTSIARFVSDSWASCYLFYFGLKWNDRNDVLWSSESSIHGEAFCRASSTRPLINGEHLCVHAWRRRGIIILNRVTWPQSRLFSEPPTRPQSAEENALHFRHTCLAW